MELQSSNRKEKFRKKQLQNNLYRLFNRNKKNMVIILDGYHVFFV